MYDLKQLCTAGNVLPNSSRVDIDFQEFRTKNFLPPPEFFQSPHEVQSPLIFFIWGSPPLAFLYQNIQTPLKIWEDATFVNLCC